MAKFALNTSKPKVGDRVFWQSDDGPKEFGTIVHVLGKRIEVQWDNPPEYHEASDTFTYDISNPASGVKLSA